MLEGRQMAQWDHTAAILAMQAEINRDLKKRRKAFGPDDFHPMLMGQKRRRKRRPKERTKDISILWQVFCG